MRKNLAVVVLVLTFLLPAVSQAARDYKLGRAAFPGEVYLGIKYGQVNYALDVPDEDGTDIRNFGFMFGGQVGDNLLLEFAYTTTVTEDESESTSSTYAADTIGLFLVGKTPGPVYLKGRLGYTIVDQDFTLSGTEFKNSNYGVAVGLGFGLKVGEETAIEVEYTVFPTTDDVVLLPGMEFDLEAATLTIAYVLVFE